jgi:hypothetical protein
MKITLFFSQKKYQEIPENVFTLIKEEEKKIVTYELERHSQMILVQIKTETR